MSASLRPFHSRTSHLTYWPTDLADGLPTAFCDDTYFYSILVLRRVTTFLVKVVTIILQRTATGHDDTLFRSAIGSTGDTSALPRELQVQLVNGASAFFRKRTLNTQISMTTLGSPHCSFTNALRRSLGMGPGHDTFPLPARNPTIARRPHRINHRLHFLYIRLYLECNFSKVKSGFKKVCRLRYKNDERDHPTSHPPPASPTRLRCHATFHLRRR